MASSPVYLRLCCELVEDNYGDFYRLIFESIAGGRLTAPQVAQRCHIPLRQAKAGLSGLIQLRLVHHHSARDAPTVYSVHLSNAYDILRAGRLVEEARKRYGSIGASAVATACELGFATINELRDRVLCDETSLEHQNISEVETLIDKLIEDRYLINLRRAHFGEVHDVRRDVELALLSPAAITKLTGSKAKLEHQNNVNIGYHKITNITDSENGFISGKFLDRRNKMLVDEPIVNGHSARLSTLVQPNYYRIVSISQGAAVRDRARKVHGSKAATILDCMIQMTPEFDVWSKPNQPLQHEINIYKLLEEVNSLRHRESVAASPEKKHINGLVNGHRVEDSTDLSVDELEGELLLLTETSFQFLENMGSSNWQVQKKVLDQWTRKEEMLRVMDSRLNPPALRILRVLIDKGKLEERTLQEIGLLGAKELRQSLSLLKQVGYLDLQEVPRNPARQPNHTIFLWSFEADRVTSLVLENIYATMVKLLQLLRQERQKIASTLAKVDREDVKGKEEEMLSRAEFTVLSRFRRTEIWMWAELHRLDYTVAILSDR